MSIKSVQDKVNAAMADHYLSEPEANDIIAEMKKDISTPTFKDEYQVVSNMRNHLVDESYKFMFAKDAYASKALRAIDEFSADYAPASKTRTGMKISNFLGDIAYAPGDLWDFLAAKL